MWDKFSIPQVMLSFREKTIFKKQYITFTPYLEGRYYESNFKYLYKKCLSEVTGTCVIYGPELLICRPSRKQLSWQILPRKFKFFFRISWGNYAIKQIYIFWKILQVRAVRMYTLQTRWSNLKTKWKQYRKRLYRNKWIIVLSRNLKTRSFKWNLSTK